MIQLILMFGMTWARLTRLRNITDPRALALVLEQAEAKLAKEAHPDPYRRKSALQFTLTGADEIAPLFPDGTKWYVYFWELADIADI